MKQAIKKKWLRALLSGKYKQGKNALRTRRGFCCLGVLCDLHAKETGNKWEQRRSGGYEYLGKSGNLPQAVIEWAGISSNPGYKGQYLSQMNDKTRMGFEGIAAIIKAGL